MIKLKNLLTEKFPSYNDIRFFNKEYNLGLTPQDLKNIASFSSAFGKRFKQLVVKKQLVKALPSIFFRDEVEADKNGIKTTAEKLMTDEIMELVVGGQFG